MQCNRKASQELSETIRMMMKSTNNFKFFDILEILTSIRMCLVTQAAHSWDISKMSVSHF